MQSNKRALGICILSITLIIVIQTPLWATFAIPPKAPVDRLIQNITAHVKKSPKDPQGYYMLGRVHHLAFTLRTISLRAWPADGKRQKLPAISKMFQTYQKIGDSKSQPPSEKQLKIHLKSAIENYQKAIKLSPKQGLYYLSLASVLEGSAKKRYGLILPPGDPLPDSKLSGEQKQKLRLLIGRLGDNDFKIRQSATTLLLAAMPDAIVVILEFKDTKDVEIQNRITGLIKTYWMQRAIASYLNAFKHAINGDLDQDRQPLTGIQSLVSHEAGRAYTRLVKQQGPTRQQQEQMERIVSAIKTLELIPRGGITPIVFALDKPRPLRQLIDAQKKVRFDMDGTGRRFAWPWVREHTAILVWDPEGQGRITSGKQLFGNVTWWMFWETGYHALAALDDNCDGWLAGPELEGLAIWFDRNTNAISDPGEVVPITKSPIERINVRASGRSGQSPMNARGLQLKDGRILPSYDWIAHPTPAPVGRKSSGSQ